MAAYAQTTTLMTPHVKKPGDGLVFAAGTTNVTNYNTTQAEITAITGLFKGDYTVVAGDTGSGWSLVWNYTSKAFTAWNGTTQATTDTNVGTASWIAVGVGA